MRRRDLAAAIAALVGLVACTQVIGPARTFRDYELKASSTASSVLSSVRTAGLAMRLGREDKAFAPYLAVLASEAEDDGRAASGTFRGIQPPDRHADALRRHLGLLLDRADAALSAVRMRARRTELGADAPALRRRLDRVGRELERFDEAHG